MVFIRTDASEKAATGHLMRCLTIGRKLEELGEKVCFLLKEKDSLKILKDQMPWRMLELGGSVKEELFQMKIILEDSRRENNQTKLLLDSYEFDHTYMSELKKYALLITFDDLFLEKFPADIIINYNLYAWKYDYAERYSKETAVLLLGGSYVPIREEFNRTNVLVRDQVETILLICGGGDRYHILLGLLKKICVKGLQKRFRILVVAGPLNPDLEQLKAFSAQWERVFLYECVEKLALLLQQADLVVSAASTVLYECCCMRRPTIFFTMAPNQEEDAEAFGKDGMMHYIGDVRKDMDLVLESAVRELELLARKEEVRNGMREKMAHIVDGKGAERIARVIVNTVTK